MKKLQLKLSLNKRSIANPNLKNIKGGYFTEYYWQCGNGGSDTCTDIGQTCVNCPVTSNDTDGHSSQCNTTNPFTIVLY